MIGGIFHDAQIIAEAPTTVAGHRAKLLDVRFEHKGQRFVRRSVGRWMGRTARQRDRLRLPHRRAKHSAATSTRSGLINASTR